MHIYMYFQIHPMLAVAVIGFLLWGAEPVATCSLKKKNTNSWWQSCTEPKKKKWGQASLKCRGVKSTTFFFECSG